METAGGGPCSTGDMSLRWVPDIVIHPVRRESRKYVQDGTGQVDNKAANSGRFPTAFNFAVNHDVRQHEEEGVRGWQVWENPLWSCRGTPGWC